MVKTEYDIHVYLWFVCFFFFFQAEDGIRDSSVTGVQTCALPIYAVAGLSIDQYLYPHTQVDAQASYRIPHAHGIQAVVSLLNLTNETFGFYFGDRKSVV